MSVQAQSYQNHRRFVPAYHYWAMGLVFVPLLFFAFRAATDFSLDRLALLLFAMGVVLLGLYARVFPLAAQDRVIRLEERLRMKRVLPEDLHPRIEEFTTPQLIGLRFATDEELPDLARRVLAGELEEMEEIKKAIEHWRPDHQRV